MATTLHELSVPTFLQTVRAASGFLDRAARHSVEIGADPDDFVQVRLFEDMAPFHIQIEAAWHHAMWGLEAAKTGVFAPPALVGPVPFADLQAMMAKAQTALVSRSRSPLPFNVGGIGTLAVCFQWPAYPLRPPLNAANFGGRTLESFTADEVNGWAGKQLDLQIGPRKLRFTSETLILSFSLPHFHFHAVTAYDILHMRGVPLGKRDYEGQLRTRPA